MMHYPMETKGDAVGISPVLLNMLSTTIGWLVNEEELNRAVENDLQRINELSRMSDAELSNIGITRAQITAFVLQESADD